MSYGPRKRNPTATHVHYSTVKFRRQEKFVALVFRISPRQFRALLKLPQGESTYQIFRVKRI